MLEQSDKRDLNHRPVSADNRAELHDAHETADGGSPRWNGATDKNVPAADSGDDQTNDE